MVWFLQTPDKGSPKLLTKILTECGSALGGGAAFAFGSARGVQLLAQEDAFKSFLKNATFKLIVGLDAITDTRAVAELRKLGEAYPNFKPLLFLHATGSLFHPKTIWLKTDNGGVIITGSGNLTQGGLQVNWEAMAVQTLNNSEMAKAEDTWNAWLKSHSKELLEVDDPAVTARAKANERVREKIKKALNVSEDETPEVEEAINAAAEVVEEVSQELLTPMLVAEAPKGANRWAQVGFDLETYRNFFGVQANKKKHAKFYQVKPDGTLHQAEDVESVSVKSKNYRFEVAAAAGLSYPTKGVPILVFEKTGPSSFNYVLRMPGHPDHTVLATYLATLKKSRAMKRIPMPKGQLKKIWPAGPFFS